MTRFAALVILFLLSWCSIQAQGDNKESFQQYYSEWTRTVKGLSQNSVYAVLQDEDGFMWFGTWDGLNKFDGYKFTMFRPLLHNPEASVINETIRCLYQDEEGFLWIGTEQGISKLDRKKLLFTHYQKDTPSPFALKSDTILSIAGKGKGYLYFGTNNGLYLFDKKTGAFFNVELTERELKIFSICLLDKGFILLGTDNGLIQYDEITGNKTIYTKKTTPGLLSDTVSCIIKDIQGNIWLGTPQGLVRKSHDVNTWLHFSHQANTSNSLSNNEVTALFQDKMGRLWVGTAGGGLNLYDYEKNLFTPFVNTPGKQNTLSNDFVNAITEDAQGNIWAGTSKGVNRMDNERTVFEHFYNIPQKANSLNNNTVWCIYETRNKDIWIGTDKGINIYDKKTGHFSFLTKDASALSGLASNQIRTIFEDSFGEFWIGTLDAGICRLNASKKRVAHYDINSPIPLPDNQVWSITEDKNNDIWIGTFNGLAKYDRKLNKTTSFFHSDTNNNSLSCNIIYHLFFDSKGFLWISTFNGLNQFDIKKRTFKTYYHMPNNYNSLSNSRIFSVYEDSEGILWIATMGGGLNKYDFRTNTIKAYTEEEGMPNNIVYNILEDNMGNLWLSTNFGLSKFNKKNETFVNYDIRDGIQSSEFNLGAACKTSDGELLFGGMQGFNLFKPESFTENKYRVPVAITAFKVFNKPRQGQYGNGDTIELSYDDNFFSFEFASLEFSNPDKIKYAFTLENFDKGWLYSDAARRYAEYTNIPPGNYTFRVKATDSQGLWLPEACHLNLIIHNVWWRTLWFRTLVFLFMLMLTGWVVYDRYRKIRRKHRWEKQKLQLEKQLFDLKQKALSLQMNPHFIFNTLNAIQTFILKDNTDQAIQFMGKLSQLMRLILSSTREVYVPLINEVKILTYYLDLEKIRFNEKFDYTIQVDNAIDTEFTGVPPMLIQPFVENAVLHGIMHKKEKGHIAITFKQAKDNIYCSVKDDGIGRDKAAMLKKEKGLSHTSRGIAIIADRLSLFEEKNMKQKRISITDLKNTDGLPAGTLVEVFLPYIEL